MSEYDYDVLQRMNTSYTQSITLWQSFWYEAEIDLRMAAGDQSYWNTYYGTGSVKNPNMLNFNKIRRVVNMISGYQRKNRLSSIIVPQENSDQQTADDLSGVVQWAMQDGNTYECISEAFEGALQTGLNLLSIWMDYREDTQNGRIMCDRLPYNSFIMDPFWTKSDLSDCNWIWQRRWLTRSALEYMLPQGIDIPDDNNVKARTDYSRDGKFSFMPEALWYMQQKLITYDEFWERSWREVKRLVDTERGEIIDWNGDNDQLQLLRTFRPNLKVVKAKKPTVTRYIVINNQVVDQEERPYGSDRYPYVPIIAYMTPEILNYERRFCSVVRDARDSQILLSRRRQIMEDILQSQINSGIIAKEDALVNPSDAFLDSQGRVLFLKKTAQMTDVLPIQAPQIPPSMIQLQEIYDKEIYEIIGANEELLGSAEDDVAGILSQLRQGAGLVTLQKLFDQLNFSQKILGQIYLDYAQSNFSPAHFARILGHEPSEQIKNRSFERFDCQVQEGLLTSTQKQMQFAQLLQLRQAGLQIPDITLIRASTLQNKQEFIDDLEQQQQAQQQAQEHQMQMQMQSEQAVIQGIQAKATSDMAAAQERQSKIYTDQATAQQKLALGESELARSNLENAKAISEIDQLDETRLMELADFLLSMQERQNAIQQESLAALQQAAVQQPQQQVI